VCDNSGSLPSAQSASITFVVCGWRLRALRFPPFASCGLLTHSSSPVEQFVRGFRDSTSPSLDIAGPVSNGSESNGFTPQSLRHTFITDMMEATNKDVKLVMSWSGHNRWCVSDLPPSQRRGPYTLSTASRFRCAFLALFLGNSGNAGIPGTVFAVCYLVEKTII